MSEYQTCDLLIEAIDEEPGGPLTKEGVELVRKGWEHGQAAMEAEITTLRQQLAKSEARVAELEHLIRYAQVASGVCMCGDDVETHNQASGHSPVDIWDHAAEKALGGTSEAWLLRKQAEAVESLIDSHSIKSMSGDFIWTEAAEAEAQRLRQQADEAERAGGEK